MKKATVLRNYYEEYLEVCSSVSASNCLELVKLLKKEDPASSINLPYGTCLMDYSSRVYSYLSDNIDEIIGYSKVEYKKGGPDLHALNFHPDDKVIFSEQVFRDIREFWSRIPTGEIHTYRFLFNHRYFRKDGTTSQLLQQSTYLEPDQSGIPLLNLLTFSDIGDYKTDNSLVLTISRLVKGEGYMKVFSKTYQQPVNSVISEREAEVLRLCLDGLSSKMIADKLFLSIQTVKNHKRKMMEKTSTRNIAELINVSIKNNWV
jgi:DNA-binding CsgD family transcriptional regulator